MDGLKSLGKTYLNGDLVKNFRSLPKSWEAKVIVIQEEKILETLPFDQLFGSLIMIMEYGR